MEFRFEKDVRHDIRDVFSSLNIRYSSSDPFKDVLLDYFTLCRKIITSIPRKVYISEELGTRLKTHPKANVVSVIVEKLKKGENLLPFQSKKVLQSSFHDYMTYEWHIYHLHLSLSPDSKNKGFMKSTDSLLFLYIENNAAYLLDIDNHRDNVFAEDIWFKLIIANWPSVANKWLDSEIKQISPKLDAQGRTLLREKGSVVGMIQIADKVYHNPGGGMATSGHSIECTIRLNEFVRWLHQIEQELIKEESKCKVMISRNSGVSTSKLHLKVKLRADGFYLIESTTGHVLSKFSR